MGILPTMRKARPRPRQHGAEPALPARSTRSCTELRGGEFEISIKGLDELIIEHDSVMLEACNSSFQVHLQVAPDEFARMYNLAQVLAGAGDGGRGELAARCSAGGCGPRRASRCSGRPSTRAATRTTCARPRRASASARGGCGSRSSRSSRRTSRGSARSSAPTSTRTPMAVLERGGIPQLKALRLHNGTIYRWNRAVLRHHGRQAAPAHREPRDAGGAERARRGRERARSGSG